MCLIKAYINYRSSAKTALILSNKCVLDVIKFTLYIYIVFLIPPPHKGTYRFAIV